MKVDVMAKDQDFAAMAGFGQMVDGVITAGRFTLRPVRQSDAGLFAMYAGDRRVAEATRSIPHPLPPGAAENFVTRSMSPKGGENVWVLDGSATGLAEVLGVISLKPMDEEKFNRGQSEIGYWVAPAFWNTGFASEAVRALGRVTVIGFGNSVPAGIQVGSGCVVVPKLPAASWPAKNLQDGEALQ